MTRVMARVHKAHLRSPSLGRSAALLLLLLVVALGAAACGSSSPEAGQSTSTESTAAADTIQAPEFSGTTLEGTEVSLSEYRGKPLVLAFMASW